MKKIILLLSALTISAFAENYIDYQAVATYEPNNEDIMGIQPLRELVGRGGIRHELDFGWLLNNQGRMGFLVAYMPKEKEYTFGGEFKYTFRTSYSGFKPYLRSTMSVGYQDKKGEMTLSTAMNKAAYVTAESYDQYKHSAKATWEEKPVFFSYSLEGGFDYDLTDQWTVSAGFEFQPKTWEVSYRVNESSEILNSLTATQYYYNAKIGLSYKF